jgi:hypothetical protein
MDRKKNTARLHPAEFREREVQMVFDHLDSYASLAGAVRDIAGKEARPTRVENARKMSHDAEVVTDRAVGSTLRMFSGTTDGDVDALFADWEERLNGKGNTVSQGADDLPDHSIEFSGPGIAHAFTISGAV